MQIQKLSSAMDSKVAALIAEELALQNRVLPLNASENLVSEAVSTACGSAFINRVAEGLPGARYHSTCEVADGLEVLAISRAQEMMGTSHDVNVQPHSGTNANLAVLFAAVKRGDSILSMTLKHGGHLSHGARASISSVLGPVYSYGVSEASGRLDYGEVARLSRHVRPRLLIAGASSYPRKIDFELFAEIAEDVGCLLLADIAHVIGLVIAGLHPSPFDCADFVTSSTQKTLRGPRGGIVFCKKDWSSRINRAVFPGVQGDPHIHVIAGKAVAFGEALSEEFKAYQAEVLANAKELAEELLCLGYDLATGGTDNHLVLLDLRRQGITGDVAERRLDSCGISSNANVIPNDPRSPSSPSGLRLGTAAATTLGLKTGDMRKVARLVDRALRTRPSSGSQAKIREEVKELRDSIRR